MLLKYVSPDLNIKGNVAIISNSKINTKKNLGHKIDKEDFVVRFNYSKIKGFEKKIGNKTNLRVINHYFFKDKYKEILNKQSKYFLIDTTNKISKKKIKKFKNLFLFDYEKILLLKYKYGLLSNVFDKHQIFGTWLNLIFSQIMTSGLTFILICVESGIRPRLYGFKKGINRQKGHYFIKPLSDKGTGRAHNSIYETFILNKLVKRKLVKLIS